MPLRVLIPQLIQLAATAAMVGIIWIVQIAIYPLFAEVGELAFQDYHTHYMERVTWVIMPLIFVEVTTCAWQFFTTRTDKRVWFSAGLLVLICLSTALIQVPLHEGLQQDEISTLISTNWFRTGAWTARLALLILIILRPKTE